MIAKLFEVRDSETGKGLFAKEFIPKGTIVAFECNKDLILTEEKINKLSDDEKESLYNQVYRKDNGVFIKPHDENVYMNHSCDPNVLDTGMGFEMTIRDIKKGEAVTCDYRVYNDIEEQSFECNCGSVNCCKYVRCQRPIKKELAATWQEKIIEAMEKINLVSQPLKVELVKKSNLFNMFFN
jgi:SET domain-containing protein